MFYLEEFRKHLESKRFGAKTIAAYVALLDRLEKDFNARGIVGVDSITEKGIKNYVDSLEVRNPGSKHFYVSVIRLKKYLAFLEDKGLIFFSPLKDYPNPKFLRHSFLSVEQRTIHAILDAIEAKSPFLIRGKAILELAYSSALRPREIYSLKVTDIDFAAGTLFIRMSKSRKDRVVPVGEKALFWIGEYLEKTRSRYIKDEKHGHVFISHKTGRPLSVFGLRSAIRETIKRCGFEPFPPYSLRSTSATALLKSGMNVAYIGKLLGHTELKTTQSYLRIGKMKLREEIAAKHPRNGFAKKGGTR